MPACAGFRTEHSLRYIMYGAGAIGGIVGGKLFMAGHEVILIARGEHLRVIQDEGLKLRVPGETHVLPIPAVNHPSQIEFRPDDVVVLTMKSQDTEKALEDLRAAAGDQVIVVCCQNGVENERMAVRRFSKVYAMVIIMPATFLEAGMVETPSWPVAGVGDLGLFPRGKDAIAEAIAADFDAAGVSSKAYDDIMPWKYMKLMGNVNNAVGAVCGADADTKDLQAMVRAEAEACFRAAGIELTPEEEFRARGNAFRSANQAAAASSPEAPAPRRSGSSTWQSLARGAGTSEGDFLNGEIALLGRLHGVPTPANEVFQILSDRLARERRQPGSVTVEEATALIEERRGSYATA